LGLIDKKESLKFGKLTCLITMAGLLLHLSAEGDGEDEGLKRMSEYLPLEWDKFLERDLNQLRTKFLRKDATAQIVPVLSTTEYSFAENNNGLEDASENGVLASHNLFQEHYIEVAKICNFQQGMSYIRPAIDKALEGDGKKVDVDSKTLSEL